MRVGEFVGGVMEERLGEGEEGILVGEVWVGLVYVMLCEVRV